VATIDPSFGVGWPYYSQTGSFFAPVSPPALGPFQGTLVALPCVNYDWLRLLLGASDQLRNPSSWKGLTDAQMVVVLSQVEELQAQLSLAGPCVICPMMRLQDCVLQFSCDSGATWTDVSGWADNFGPCVQSAAIITTPPANPDGRTTDEMACSVASYITDQVITVAMQAAVDNINNNRNLLQLGVDLALTIPEFVLVGLFVNAVADFYTFFSSMTVSDFETALTDPTLFSDIRCAIYTAIAADGHLTTSNFPAVLSNVCGISYVHSDVIDAICGFLTTAGFAYINQLSQGAGLNPFDDCSDCGGSPTWCYEWNFAASDGGWAVQSPGQGHWSTGGWKSDVVSGQDALIIGLAFSAVAVTEMRIMFTADGVTGLGARQLHASLSGVDQGPFNLDSGTYTTPHGQIWSGLTGTTDFFACRLDNQPNAGGTEILRLQARGTGINPFGTNNCTF